MGEHEYEQEVFAEPPFGEDDLEDEGPPWPSSPEEIEAEYPEDMAERADFADNELDLVEPEAPASLAVTASVVETKPQVQALAAESFPVDALPGTIREFVAEHSKALSAPPDLVAVPTLVAASAAIGNACRIQVKEGWTEPANLYTAIVGASGTRKSPAQDAATAPVRNRQSDMRTWTSDATVERLADLLHENPRGLAVIRDEVAGLVRSFNQYKGGKGADKEFYLSAWSGQSFRVDRRNGTEIIVPRPFVSVVGGIPPEVLQELAGQFKGDGFFERILWAYPDRVKGRWTDFAVSSEAQGQYNKLFDDLYALPYEGEPTFLNLTAQARAYFSKWHDAHCEEAESPALSPFLQGSYAKLIGYCARLALIHQLCTNPKAVSVEIESVAAATAMIDYFKLQARKVATVLAQAETSPVEKCKAAIRRRLSVRRSPINRRELQRSLDANAKDFKQALEELSNPEVLVKKNDSTEWIELPWWRQVRL